MRVALVNGKIRLDEASITVEDEAQVPCDSSASDSDSESVAEDAEDAAAQRVRKRPHNLRTRRLHPKSTSGDGTSPWGASLSPALKRRRGSGRDGDQEDVREWEVHHRFDVLGPLGKGSFGAVWEARCKGSAEIVAIKRVKDIFRDVETAKRVLRELWILRRCDHINVIALRDVITAFRPGEQDVSSIVLVMEKCDSDLARLFARGVRLSLSQAQAITAQLFNGLGYLHEMRVLHRDLKPANVLVNRGMGVRICDFGLARVYAGPDHSTTVGEAQTAAEPATRTTTPEVPTAPVRESRRAGRRVESSQTASDPSPPPKRRFRPKKKTRTRSSSASQESRSAGKTPSPLPPPASAPGISSTDLTPEHQAGRGPGQATSVVFAKVPAGQHASSLHEAGAQEEEEEEEVPRPPSMARSMTCTHIVTKWYRAPEIALEQPIYDYSVDVWSAGCILAELLQCIDDRPSSPRSNEVPGVPAAEPGAAGLEDVATQEPAGREECADASGKRKSWMIPRRRTTEDGVQGARRPDFDSCFNQEARVHPWRPIALFRTLSLQDEDDASASCNIPDLGYTFEISKENFSHLKAILAVLGGPNADRRTLESAFPRHAVDIVEAATAIVDTCEGRRGSAVPVDGAAQELPTEPRLVRNLRQLCPRAPAAAVDLTVKCLEFLPHRRISAREAATWRIAVGEGSSGMFPSSGHDSGGVPRFQTPGVLPASLRSPNALVEPNPQRSTLLVNMGMRISPGVLTRSQSQVLRQQRLLDPVEQVVAKRMGRIVAVLRGRQSSCEVLPGEDLSAIIPSEMLKGFDVKSLSVKDVRDAVQAEVEDMMTGAPHRNFATVDHES